MIVMKFGGTSVGSALAINNLYKVVKKQFETEKQVVVFVSALSGVTNLLIELNGDVTNFVNRNSNLYDNQIINENNKQIDNRQFTQTLTQILNLLQSHFKNEISKLVEFYLKNNSTDTFKISEFQLNANNERNNFDFINVINKIYYRHFELINELFTEIFFNSNVVKKDNLNAKELDLFFYFILEQLNSLSQKVISCIKIQDITNETTKIFLSYGELLSSEIISYCLKLMGLPVVLYNILNDFTYDNIDGKETIIFKNKDLIKEKLSSNIILTQGFIARDLKGNITNLGRGGSDYSAAIFAVEFDATELQIWTDVSGVKTADPRIIKDAKTINTIDINSLNQMAYWGAKVLHPATLLPTLEKNINVKILNTFDLGEEFTEVKNIKLNEFDLSEIKNSESQNFASFILKTNTLLIHSNDNIRKSIFSQKSELNGLHLIEDIILLSISKSENLNYNEVYTIVVITDLLEQHLIHISSTIFDIFKKSNNIKIELCNFDLKQNMILICIDKNTNNIQQIQNLLNQLHNDINNNFLNQNFSRK